MSNERIDGFTLLEVLISMVILAVGLLALSSMQGTSATGNAQSRRLTQAMNLASSKIDDLKIMSYNSSMLSDTSNDGIAGLSDTGEQADQNSTSSLGNFDYTVYWNIAENATFNFKQIKVIVNWNQGEKDVALDWIKPKSLN